MYFSAVSLVVGIEMHSLCLITSKELILIAKCNLLYLLSNNLNNLKSITLKEKN